MIHEYRDKILQFYSQHRRMPGYNELLSLTGFRSKNAVYKLINKLVDIGFLEKDARGKLSLLRNPGELPLLGLVEAGFPMPAEEQELDTISIEDWLIKNKESSYMLRVKGDSMYDAGIRDGDMVIAERTENARAGDIVIANIDGQWTMKYLRYEHGRAFLEPANELYSNLYPEQSLSIAAKVVGVIRKYT